MKASMRDKLQFRRAPHRFFDQQPYRAEEFENDQENYYNRIGR